jgi:hypothetical protein
MAFVSAFIKFNGVLYMKGSRGADTFDPPGINYNGPTILFGGDGPDFYNAGIPSPAQITYTLETGIAWSAGYHGAVDGFNHPWWSIYDAAGGIATRTISNDNDIAHGGWGTVFKLGPGADTFFFHGRGHDGVGVSRFWFSEADGDKIFMDNGDKSRDVDGDGFRFHDAKWAENDATGIAQLHSVKVTAFSENPNVDAQTLHVFTNKTNHGPFVPVLVEYDDAYAKAEVYDRIESWVGDLIL